MLSQINYLWRLMATGVSFAMFGLGGLLLSLTLFPLINLLIWNPQRRKVVGQYIVHLAFRFFIGFMNQVGILDYEIIGRDKLEGEPCLILANHPSLIDVVFLISLMKKVDCIVKQALVRNPFTYGPIRAAGYIGNDGAEALMDDCVDSLSQGNSLVVFPEGTRTSAGEALRFQRGAANIAIRAKCKIRPVTIRVSPTTLTKAEKWYQIPNKKFKVSIYIADDMDVASLIEGAPNSTMATRLLTRYLENYFTQEVQTNV
ncbi:hypothetical protein A9Q99_16085 [Gammaproteobacteria bacterium 45_16_T64]|nr:hypothetical protein A9Q99_16085 [Gammaproteobacteria bacterium 45_16_T64]